MLSTASSFFNLIWSHHAPEIQQEDETNWLMYIDNYFETWQNIDFEDKRNNTQRNDGEHEFEFE